MFSLESCIDLVQYVILDQGTSDADRLLRFGNMWIDFILAYWKFIQWSLRHCRSKIVGAVISYELGVDGFGWFLVLPLIRERHLGIQLQWQRGHPNGAMKWFARRYNRAITLLGIVCGIRARSMAIPQTCPAYRMIYSRKILVSQVWWSRKATMHEVGAGIFRNPWVGGRGLMPILTSWVWCSRNRT